MNLTVTGHHIDVTPAMREYVSGKMERILRHIDNVTSINVILEVEKLVQKAEVTLHVRGKDIFVEADSTDMYAAIDSMIDKLDRKVLKHKEKNQGHSHAALKHQETIEDSE